MILLKEKGMFNGSNSNPTYANYCKTVNSVVLGQSLKSRARKSNAGLESAKCFSISTEQPLLKRCKKSPKKKRKSTLKVNKISKKCLDFKYIQNITQRPISNTCFNKKI